MKFMLPKDLVYKRALAVRPMPENQAVINKEFVSPDGKKCLAIYGMDEVRMGYTFGNFMLLTENDKTQRSLLQSDDAAMCCWVLKDCAAWSADSRYLVIDIYPAITKYKVSYRDAKLIVDTIESKVSVVPIAGGSFYNNVEITGAGKVLLSKKQGKRGVPEDNIHIENAETEVDSLKWQPLKGFNRIVKLLETGYFGNIVGYVNDEINVRFKKGFTPWPYKDAGVK